jgi:hypothetical protein
LEAVDQQGRDRAEPPWKMIGMRTMMIGFERLN